MPAPRERLESLLRQLLGSGGVDGVELIRRDGQCLLECYRTDLDLPAYSHLSALMTVLSEGMLSEIRARQSQHAVTEADSKRFVMVKANEDLLLAALTDPNRPAESILRALQQVASEVPKLAYGA